MPAVKYKLAEYRYGREEMLLLFESNTKPPDELRRENAPLVKEECQQPLALIPMTEEETALWATPVNSEVVLRLSNNKDRDRPAGPGRAPPNLSDRIPDSRSGVRGDVRAGPAPAGGRGIGAAPGMRVGVPIRPPPAISSNRTAFGYGRSFEDEPEGDRREGFRGDVFKRGISLNQEDQRNDRFRPDPDETKPRNRLDSRSNAENWRSAGRSANEGPNWRSSARREDGSNWKAGASSSWREDGPDDQSDHRNGRNRYRSNDWEHQHGDDGANLPEWSLDDGGTSVGTFDASGAFRSGSPGRELEDDGEGEWTSVRSNRTKRDREKDHHHPDRQQPLPQHRDDQMSVVRDSADHSQSLMSKNLFHDHDSRSDEIAATRSDNKNGTSSIMNPEPNPLSGRDFDEDFSFEKLAESMVTKWTEEEEAKSGFSHVEQHDRNYPSESAAESGTRWYYRDPQGKIQGPFVSSEMMEWFKAGYFEMNLLVRRSGDERFSQLGILIESCGGQIPFAPGAEMPPVRQDPAKSVHAGQTSQTATQPVSHPNNDLQIRQMLMYQQMQQQQQQAAAAQQRQQQQQQLQQQQLAQQQQQQMQTQLRQLLEHLKRQEGFTELSQIEQQQVLLRQYTQLEQSRRSQLITAEAAPQPAARAAPTRFPTPANSGPSIWELSNGGVMTSAALEEIQRREQEEQERKEEQKRKLMEDEQRRRHEAEIARKQAEEDQRRQMLEQQRKRDEERKKEERAKQEEEMRRFQEEERIAEEKRREEQRRRHEEMRKLEEMARKQKEDAERCRQKEEEEKIRQMQKQQQEIERQRHEHETRLRLQQREQQQQQAEAMKRFQEKRGWAEVSPAGQLSLSEIQRLQEEKEFEERLEQMKQKASMRQNFYQNANQKPGMSWVQPSTATAAAGQVKTLSEIQREEAEKLAKVRKEQEERNRDKPQAAGIWSNAASQLSWKASAGSAWGSQSPTQSAKPSSSNLTGVGFWETDAPAVVNNHKQQQQPGSKDNSAKQQQPASGQQGKQTSAKSRKAEVTQTSRR